jgi:hypothetical protein
MLKFKLIPLLIVSCILGACASTKSAEIFSDKKITSPKIVAIQGIRAPWVYEIEKRLKKRGFQIKRIASQHMAIEKDGPQKTIAYNEASARFLLSIDGFASSNKALRCFAGGYDFDYIDIELIDIVKNETVLHYSNSGYSENCSPLSGTIFTDIENLVNSAWK